MASSSPPRPDTPHGRPQILQPVPRRPFDLDLSLTTPTPPAAEPTSPSGPSQDLDLDLLDSRLAAAGSSVQATAGGVEPGGLLNPASGGNIASDSLSRARSLVDLTSSTLFGIYAAASSASISGLAGSSSQQQHNSRPQEQPDAVADTDEAGDRELVAVMRERRSFGEASGAATAELRRLRTLREDSTGTLRRRTALFASNLRLLAPRAALLFVLGLGYGVLLVEGLRGRQGESTSRRADENDGSSREPTAETPSWDFLVFWGIAGVLLGAALPWFDGVWDAMSAGAAASRHKPAAVVEETDQEIETSFRGKQGLCPSSKNHEPVISGAPAAATAGTDWFGAMRAAGTFLGVCFAIRKLPWASTLQVSTTLALANPALWYLIDRSLPGFLLSSAVGLAGSAALLLFGGAHVLVPAPAALRSSSTGRHPFTSSSGGTSDAAAAAVNLSSSASWSLADLGVGTAGIGARGSPAAEALESGMWMLTLLFCSCVCFGNIGRRLAPDGGAKGRGRLGSIQ